MPWFAVGSWFPHSKERLSQAGDLVLAGQETSARRSPSKVEATQAPSAQASNPRGKKGSKFAQIKAQEAARKAARVAASGLAQASGKIQL